VSPGRPTTARIDLAALRANLAAVRSMAPGRAVIAVVKADGYGHGGPAVARALAEAGVEQLAVLTVAEARSVREAGVERPLLLLAGVHDDAEAAEAVGLGATPVVHDPGGVERVARAAAAAGRRCPVHVEIDTGMRRMGVAPERAVDLVAAVAEAPALDLAGTFTHLARADEKDLAPTREQLARFGELLAEIRERGIDPGLVHAANSAGVLAWPELADAAPPTDAVRPGIFLYGSNPVAHAEPALEPVMTFATAVVAVRDVREGEAVGYGGFWQAPGPGRIATLAAGYADGVPRCLAEPGRPPAHAAIGARRFPLAGRVSMDYVTVDLGRDANDVSVGDEAVLFGRTASGDVLPVDVLAEAAGTLGYELLVRIGGRVPRVIVS
jgi:alanine racemase